MYSTYNNFLNTDAKAWFMKKFFTNKKSHARVTVSLFIFKIIEDYIEVAEHKILLQKIFFPQPKTV